MTQWDLTLLLYQKPPRGDLSLRKSVDPMVVTIKPPNREEYKLSIDAPPVFSSALSGGYEQAEVSCELNDEEREKALGARLRIHGQDGISWQGIVKRRPGRGEPVQAQGWGWCATFGRRAITYSGTETTKDIVYDVMDDEVDVAYLPSGTEYLAWIDAESTQAAPVEFQSSDAASKCEEMTKYARNAYGWYMEYVTGIPYCVPHWTVISTSPDYVISLPDSDAYDLDESSLDELVSAVRVAWTDSSGATYYKDVTDADTAHPLVELGITRYGDVSISSNSSATASGVGNVFLSDYGRTQTKGTVTTQTILTSTGVDAYLPSIRCGQMARIYGLPQGQVDAVIKRITCTGDTVCTIELDNVPYKLDILLSQLMKRTA